mgnify:CR=1 FL=1|tara:strand:- start:308 stop:1891 length:1584 start_codon:yes stop_codon:yes gene_type:complete
MISKISKYQNFIIIFVIYSISFSAILINSGLFWDGWVINNSSADQLIQMFKDNGNYWYGYLFAIIKNTGSIILFSRLITFVAYLLVGFMFYQIVKQYIPLLSNYSLILTLYFVTFPVNFARITIMNTPYALCLMMFSVAYMFSLSRNNNSLNILIIAFCLFFSLFMSSLLFLMPILLIHKFIYYGYSIDISGIKSFMASNSILFLVPLIYIALKLLFLDSSGMYIDSNYNQITINRVFALPFRFIEGLYSSVFLPINMSINYSLINSTLVLIMLFILNKLKILKQTSFNELNLSNSDLKKLILLSILLIFLGMFAYLLVGKTPSLTNWNSRHQILVPIGASIFVFVFISLILGKIKSGVIKAQLALLPIAIFVVFNINIYFSYIIDWYKQESFIENVIINEELMDSNTFIIIDNTKELNALNRSKSFIDYTGIFKKRLITEDKLADENKMLDLNEYQKYKADKVYGISDWEPSPASKIAYLNYGSFVIDNLAIFKMTLNRFINKSKNVKNIQNILKIEVIDIGDYHD